MSKLADSLSQYSNMIVGLLIVTAVVFYVSRQSSSSDSGPLAIEPSSDPFFQKEVVASDLPVLVKFGAGWCPPCVATDKVLEKLEPELASKIKIVMVDVDQQTDLKKHYGVGAIPHSFIFYKGKVLGHRLGGMDESDVRAWVDRRLQDIPGLAAAK